MSGADPEVTIYSDYVCPFCYLGRRSFEQYEADRGEPLAIDWRPFDLRAQRRGPDGELDPDAADGKDDTYYERARRNVRRLRQRYGVEMTQELATEVDSLPAQLISYHLKESRPDRWRDFDEAVFEALWIDARDIGDADVLADLAADVGIDPGVVSQAIEDEALRDRVFELFEDAYRRGVTGVPTFEYDGYVARGAVPPDQLRRLIEGGDDA